jgi:hypothetical protein
MGAYAALVAGEDALHPGNRRLRPTSSLKGLPVSDLSTLIDEGVQFIVVGGAAGVCHRAGRWLDANKPAAVRKKYALALRSGRWVDPLQTLCSDVGTSLDRWLGVNYVSWRMACVSLFLSISSTTAVALIYWERLPQYINSEISPTVGIAWTSFAARLFLSFIFDWITLIRVRDMCRDVMAGKIWKAIPLSILLDAVTIVLFFSFLLRTEIAFLGYFAQNPGPIPTSRVDYVGIAQQGRHYLSAVNWSSPILENPFVVMAIASITPGLIFYMYTCAVLLATTALRIGEGARWVTHDAKLTQPFTFITDVAGATLVVMAIVVKIVRAI